MVRNLEDINPRQAASQQPRIHVVLGVTGQQEAAPGRLAKQHDGRVVYVPPGAAGGRLHAAGLRPQDADGDCPQTQDVTSCEHRAWRSPRATKERIPCAPPWAAAAHPGLKHAANSISLERPDQPRNMILVRMRQDDNVQPAVPRRHNGVEF